MAWLYRSGHGLIDLALRCHDPDRRASQFVEFVGYERLREDGLTDRERPDSSSIWSWFTSFAVMLDISGPKAIDYVNQPQSEWSNEKLSEGVKCSGKGGIDSFLGHSQSCCGLVNASFRCTDGYSWHDSGTNWNGNKNNMIQCPTGQAFVGAQVMYGAISHLKKVFKNDHQGIINVRFQCEESKYPPVAVCEGLPFGWKSVITSASFPVEIGQVIQVSCSRDYINTGDREVTCLKKDQFSYTEEPFCKDAGLIDNSHFSASQSGSRSVGGAPERAIDGNTNGEFSSNSCTITAGSVPQWWKLDLAAGYEVSRVAIYNIAENGQDRMIDGAQVFTLSGGTKKKCGERLTFLKGKRVYEVECGHVIADQITIEIQRGILTLCEVEIYSDKVKRDRARWNTQNNNNSQES
ncbi:uncharacterized protein LOC134821611 [Bolinopsis microptera]|uniref:uncharacterized protein LOC134821611 n=1 Tax=Bolinopsis microptera TaxID=2820187 RepID=UPI0030791066